MAIFLARHGETEWNRVGRWQGSTDIPLSEVGRAQALALAERLRGCGIAEARASDLSRARETAEIVAAALGVAQVRLDARFRERSFGCFEGLTREECAERHADAWQRYLADRRDTPNDAEPYEQVAARMMAGLTAITDLAEPDRHVLVVSHGAAIRTFIHVVTGTPPPPLANTALFRVAYEAGSFSSIEPA
jgi:broad specificity phosphatase PhoE